MRFRRVWAVVEAASVVGVAAIAVFDGNRGAVILTAGIAVFGYFAVKLRPTVLAFWNERIAPRRSGAASN